MNVDVITNAARTDDSLSMVAGSAGGDGAVGVDRVNRHDGTRGA
ncbi:hypothetical protein [Shewanella frigidimarina]|nr:hypothetical protein [Shewanella frigidimarina]